jgi:hypothetical protein
MDPMSCRVAALGIALVVLAGCGDHGRRDREPPAPVARTDLAARSPLFVAPSSRDFSRNRPLLDRILANPHGYFRFVNREFAQQVCKRFDGQLALVPLVNLHGDAHVEQYAVTDSRRGLTDFDDSAIGPAVLDLVRFGVSLRLTQRANGWSGDENAPLEALLRGYREALTRPDEVPAPPAVVARLRAQFGGGHHRALAQAEQLIDPNEIPLDKLHDISRRYREQMIAANPELGPDFFVPKRAGRLRIGVGSALDEKYLIRAEGPTPDDDDDIILEAKEVRDLSGIDCIQSSPPSDPFRILTAQSRIAYEPYRLTGYAMIRPPSGDRKIRTFWIHQWEDNYVELRHDRSLRSPDELEAVAYDVGFQLGLGHPKEIADPHGAELRRALGRAIDELEPKLVEVVAEMTGEVVSAWEQFKAAAR